MPIKQTPLSDLQHNYVREIIQKRAPTDLWDQVAPDEAKNVPPPKPTLAVKLGWLASLPGTSTASAAWATTLPGVFRLCPEWRHYYYSALLSQYGFFKGAFHSALQTVSALDKGDTLRLQSAPPPSNDPSLKGFTLGKPQVALSEVVISPQLLPTPALQQQEARNAAQASQWASVAKAVATQSPAELLPILQGFGADGLNHNYLALREGFVYVFKGASPSQMTLDQEYRLQNEELHPVDLASLAGLDQRAHSDTTLPTLALEPNYYYQIAVSHWQWSWARINYFGGLEPAYPNLSSAAKNAIATQAEHTVAPASGSVASDRRAKRFGHAIHITEAMLQPQPQTPEALVAGLTSPRLLTLKTGEPLIWCVDDPIRMALEISNDLIAAQASLIQSLKVIGDKPYSDSALAAYQTFFNPRLAKRCFSEQVYDTLVAQLSAGGMGYLTFDEIQLAQQTAAQTPNRFAKAGDKLDEPSIRAVLSVDTRRQLRYQIRWLQTLLVELMMTPGDSSTGRVSIMDALQDGFSAGEATYGEAFAAVTGLLARTASDPSSLDEKFDITPDEIISQADPMPSQILAWNIGARYLNTLSKPAHPLHRSLFPEVTVTNNGQTLQYTVIENDGSGQFRLHPFRANYYEPSIYAEFLKAVQEARAKMGETNVPNSADDLAEGFQDEGLLTPKGAIKAMVVRDTFAEYQAGLYLFDRTLAGVVMLLNQATHILSPSRRQLLTMREALDLDRLHAKTQALYLVKATNDVSVLTLTTADQAHAMGFKNVQLLGQVPYWQMGNFGAKEVWNSTPTEGEIPISQQYRHTVQDAQGNWQYHYSNATPLGFSGKADIEGSLEAMIPKTRLLPLNYPLTQSQFVFNPQVYEVNGIVLGERNLEVAERNPGIMANSLDWFRSVNTRLFSKHGLGAVFAGLQMFNLIDSIETLHQDLRASHSPQAHEAILEDWLKIAWFTQDMLKVSSAVLDAWCRHAIERQWSIAEVYRPAQKIIETLAEWTHPELPIAEAAKKLQAVSESDAVAVNETNHSLIGVVKVIPLAYLKYMGDVGPIAMGAFSIYDLMHSHNLSDFIGNGLGAALATAQSLETVAKIVERRKKIAAYQESKKLELSKLSDTQEMKGLELVANTEDSALKIASNALVSSSSYLGTGTEAEAAVTSLADGIIACIPLLGEISIALMLIDFAYEIVETIIVDSRYKNIQAWSAFGPFGKTSQSKLGQKLRHHIPNQQSWYWNTQQWMQTLQAHPLPRPAKSWKLTEQDERAAFFAYQWANPQHGPVDCYACLMGTLGNPAIAITDSTWQVPGTPANTPIKQVLVNMGASSLSTGHTKLALKSLWVAYQQLQANLSPEAQALLAAQGVPASPNYVYKAFEQATPQILQVIQIRDATPPHAITAVIYVINNHWQKSDIIELQLWTMAKVNLAGRGILPQQTIDQLIAEFDGKNPIPPQDRSACPPPMHFELTRVDWVHGLPSPLLRDIVVVK